MLGRVAYEDSKKQYLQLAATSLLCKEVCLIVDRGALLNIISWYFEIPKCFFFSGLALYGCMCNQFHWQKSIGPGVHLTYEKENYAQMMDWQVELNNLLKHLKFCADELEALQHKQ
jgi:hypothetical protein